MASQDGDCASPLSLFSLTLTFFLGHLSMENTANTEVDVSSAADVAPEVAGWLATGCLFQNGGAAPEGGESISTGH